MLLPSYAKLCYNEIPDELPPHWQPKVRAQRRHIWQQDEKNTPLISFRAASSWQWTAEMSVWFLLFSAVTQLPTDSWKVTDKRQEWMWFQLLFPVMITLHDLSSIFSPSSISAGGSTDGKDSEAKVWLRLLPAGTSNPETPNVDSRKRKTLVLLLALPWTSCGITDMSLREEHGKVRLGVYWEEIVAVWVCFSS